MTRTLILIAVFLFSLSLVTLAYSQSNMQQTLNSSVTNSPTSACPVGSQVAAAVGANRKDNAVDNCGQYSGYIQGACCCNMSTGQLMCPSNPVCVDALRNP